MAFTSFRTVDALVRKYGLVYRKAEFVVPVPGAELAPAVRDEIQFILREYAFDRSEAAARESLIFPILKDVWRHYRADLTLLSGEPVEFDADLRGEVDYVVCRRSPSGPFVADLPYFLIGGAKRDDATVGWNQALGGMLAARGLDPTPGRVYFGLATTGRTWSFGKLEGDDFTVEPVPVSVNQLDRLAGSLHYLFAACRDQVRAMRP